MDHQRIKDISVCKRILVNYFNHCRRDRCIKTFVEFFMLTQLSGKNYDIPVEEVLQLMVIK